MPHESQIKPINEERPFGLSDLFFSTTDTRGVIRYGNEVFSRIAAYPLSEMIGQPHNLIRHEDMPRCAFRLVWDYLKQGQTVAAYVKNMASDGRYYWVLAVIMPTPDGYLSIRLKPTSEVFKTVQQAYAAVLQAERAAAREGASSKAIMDAGAAKLMALLGSLGFASYDQFMWAAMAAEMANRQTGLRQEPHGDGAAINHADAQERDRLVRLFDGSRALEQQLGDVIARPGTFSQLRDQIIPKSNFILELGQSIRLQSVNAEIQAARLGDTAQALAMVAQHLSMHASEGEVTVTQLNERLRQLVKPIAELVFYAMVSKIQVEMAAAFVREILEAKHDVSEHASIAANLQLLFRTFLGTARGVPEALERLQDELADVDRNARRLEKFMRTLGFIYLSGKIETARHEDAQSFAAIFEEIQAMIHEANSVIQDLLQHVAANRQQIKAIGSIDTAVFDDLETQLVA